MSKAYGVRGKRKMNPVIPNSECSNCSEAITTMPDGSTVHFCKKLPKKSLTGYGSVNRYKSRRRRCFECGARFIRRVSRQGTCSVKCSNLRSVRYSKEYRRNIVGLEVSRRAGFKIRKADCTTKELMFEMAEYLNRIEIIESILKERRQSK